MTVARGGDAGGDFRHIRGLPLALAAPLRRRVLDVQRPRAPDAAFGRTTTPGREVLCTNPAALAGGAAPVDPIFPHEPFAAGTAIAAALDAIGFPVPQSSATWLSFPDAYSARCVNEGGANVLQVTGASGAPALTPVPAPSWGLHFTDANIALGDLERLVGRQARAYRRAR